MDKLQQDILKRLLDRTASYSDTLGDVRALVKQLAPSLVKPMLEPDPTESVQQAHHKLTEARERKERAIDWCAKKAREHARAKEAMAQAFDEEVVATVALHRAEELYSAKYPSLAEAVGRLAPPPKPVGCAGFGTSAPGAHC